MKKQLLLIALLLYSVVNFGQHQNNHWYFGYHAHLNFNLGTQVQPTQPTNQYMPLSNNFSFEFIEGCATVSDYTSGAVKFYSNGSNIYGPNHLAITNGTGLKGNFSSAQNIVFLPKPQSVNTYYAFTIDGFTGNNAGLFYSEINASGTPSVVSNMKNVPLKDHTGMNIDEFYSNPANLNMSNQAENMTTVKHSNGFDYWLVAQVNNYIYTYLIDCNGVNPMPVKSYSFTTNYPFIEEITPSFKMKISQNNDAVVKIAKVFGKNMGNDNDIITGTFDRATGQVTFNNTVPIAGIGYALEFSQSSDILYFSDEDHVMKYKFSTGQLNALSGAVGLKNGVYIFDMQMAPNGVIYVAAEGRRDLGGITNSSDFNNVSYNAAAVRLAGLGSQANITRSSMGLPQLVQQHAPISLIANNDSFSMNGCTTNTSAGVVQSNDTVNGVLVTSLTGLSINSVGMINPIPTSGGITLNANGTVTVLAGTPDGTYTLSYQICTSSLCPVCSNTGVITVNVSSTGSVLTAVNDNFSYDICNDMNPKMNVKYKNPSTADSINGTPITSSTTGITVQQTLNSLNPAPATGGITIATNGNIIVDNATPLGTYTLKYKLLVSGNCPSQSNEAIATINVVSSATYQPITIDNAYLGVSVGSTSSETVLSDVTFGGVQATESDVVITVSNPAYGITINPNGTVTVPPGTPSGEYSIAYMVCQKCMPSNCSGWRKIYLSVGIIAKDDALYFDSNGVYVSGNTNVFANDTYLRDALNPELVSLSYVANPYFTIDTNSASPTFGKITITYLPAGYGNYQYQYTICELSNTSNCSSAYVALNVASSGRVVSNEAIDLKSDKIIDNVKVYPNPSSGVYNIQLSNQNSTEANLNLTVHNTLGQKIIEKEISQNNSQIDLSSFENGTYFLKLQVGEETINKIIVKK